MANGIVPRLSVKVVNRTFKTRYRLAKLTRKSKTFNKIVVKAAFDGDDMVVLPKDGVVRRTIETNIGIEGADEATVLPSDVVKDVMSKTEDIFIMDFCLCRQSNQCHDFPIDVGCVFLGNGIHRIPEKYGHVATYEEAAAHIDRCGSLGLVHIIGRNKLDRLWLNTGKGNDLITICNCCPCCCLWNMVREISDEISSTFRRMESVEVSVDADRCTGCGICTETCFTRAMSVKEGRCDIDQSACRGCGRCVDMCPVGALSLSFDPAVTDAEVERIASKFKSLKPEARGTSPVYRGKAVSGREAPPWNT
ncbi:MAG: 4Fe-4S binding protein [Candidatus Methanomethylophilaceae archaeon]|nr:4Fe-4S binding protein [Candidatus Methanomethylophilaceae archaeon]